MAIMVNVSFQRIFSPQDALKCGSDRQFQTHFKPQLKQLSSEVRQIIEHIISPTNAGATYESLAYFVDKFGPRMAGTKQLEDSIDFMLDWLKKDGHDNVHGENVTIPKWVSILTIFFYVHSTYSSISLYRTEEPSGL